jgi:hypothetical protein
MDRNQALAERFEEYRIRLQAVATGRTARSARPTMPCRRRGFG